MGVIRVTRSLVVGVGLAVGVGCVWAAPKALREYVRIDIGMERTAVEARLGKPVAERVPDGKTTWYLAAPVISPYESPYAPGSIGITYTKDGRVHEKELNPQVRE